MTECALVIVEGRYELGQSLVEAGYGIRRLVLELADVEQQVDDRRPRPDAWAAIDFRCSNLDHKVALWSRGLLGVHVNDPADIQIEAATARQDVQ
jgi:hypothetical protein